MSAHAPPTFKDVLDARERIEPYAHKTPVLTCDTIDKLAGLKVYFKCENFQKIGAFKFRGACNAVFKMDKSTCEKGVTTHSSGNHAQALALAARMRDIKAYIVMPETAPDVKRNAVLGYGAEVILCKPNLQARETTTQKVVDDTGAVMIHPYNNPDIIAGQGTTAVEFLEEVPSLDAIIAPVGGGGLMSGICIASKAVKPSIRVFAGEPSGADDAFQSMKAGAFVPSQAPKTIADGLMTSLGDLTWPIIKENVEEIITVSDDEIKSAMKLIWERMKIIIEPSSAVPLAAVLSPRFQEIKKDMKSIGIVISGGNIDLEKWKW